MPLASGTVLDAVVTRVRTLAEAEVVVATSDGPSDDALAGACRERGYTVFRGSEADVLGRYAAAADEYDFDAVLRVCADAPLTDPDGMSGLIQEWCSSGSARYVHNRHDRGWPIGAAADLIERSALLEACREATDPFEREHVIPFLLAHPERFATRAVLGRADWAERRYYMAIDYPSDLNWFQELYNATGCGLKGPALAEVFDWVDHSGRMPRLNHV